MRESDEKETSVRFFRSGHRYFCMDGKWYFSTRESEEGPFGSREAAEAALERYLNSLEMLKKLQTPDQVAKSEDDKKDRGDPTIWDRQFDAI